MEKEYKSPIKISLLNTSHKTINFVPYRENQNFPIEHGDCFTFRPKTFEEAMYYENQKLAFDSDDKRDRGITETEITLPQNIKIENIGNVDITLPIYKEKLTFTIGAGDSITFKAYTNEEVFYYLLQRTHGIEISLEEGSEPSELVTLTYSLGAYGMGMVPSPVSVEPGTSIEVSFMPSPMRMGCSFKGWAREDNQDIAEFDPTQQPVYITIYENTTLYPVFEGSGGRVVMYNMGTADGGMVPSSQMGMYGSTITLTFTPHPTKTGYDFAGWSTDEYAQVPEYSESGTTTMQLLGKEPTINLYPVFIEGIGSNQMRVDNTQGEYEIEIWHEGGNSKAPVDPVTDLVVSAGAVATLNIQPGIVYQIDYKGNAPRLSAFFNGVYQGTEYTNYQTGANSNIAPPGGGNSYWTFQEGDSGTLAILPTPNRLYITNNSNATFYSYHYDGGKGATRDGGDAPITMLEPGQSVSWDFFWGEHYGWRYEFKVPSASPLTVGAFSGTYQGNSITTNCSISEKNGNIMYNPLGGDIWEFSDGDIADLIIGEPSLQSNQLKIDNTNGGGTVDFYYNPDENSSPKVLTKGDGYQHYYVSAGEVDIIDIIPGVKYNTYCDMGKGYSATFTGTYHDDSYTNQSCAISDNQVMNPQDRSDWSFYEGDRGTLTFNYEASANLSIDNSLGNANIDLERYQATKADESGYWVHVDTVYSGSSDHFTVNPGERYQLCYYGDYNDLDVTYNGTYQGQPYDYTRNSAYATIPSPTSSNSWEFYGDDNISIAFTQKVNRLTIDNREGDGEIIVTHIEYSRDDSDPGTMVTDATIYGGMTSVIEFTPGVEYAIQSQNTSSGWEASYDGKYQGTTYYDASLSVNAGGYLTNPTLQSNGFTFSDGDVATLTIYYPSSSSNDKLTISASGYGVNIYEDNDGSYSLVHTVNSGITYDYEYDPSKKFMLGLASEQSSDIQAQYSGEYNGTTYTDELLEYTSDQEEWPDGLQRFAIPSVESVSPFNVADFEWQLTSGEHTFNLFEVSGS